MAKVKFILNQREFQKQILYSPQLGKMLGDALSAASHGAEQVVVSDSPNTRGTGRVRARAYSRDPNLFRALDDEAQTGQLNSILGRVRL